MFRGLETEELPNITDQLMSLSCFAVTVLKCHNILQSYGINLFNIKSDHRKLDLFDSVVMKDLRVTSIQVNICELFNFLQKHDFIKTFF